MPCRDTRRATPARRRGARGLRNRPRISSSQAGFTLLEITLVIVIISVVITLVLPRFRDAGRAELQSQAQRLQMVFKLMRSEAVLNGAAYRLNYDLDKERYWVTPEEGTDLADFARDFGSLGRGTQMKAPVEFIDVDLPALAGKVAQGQIFTVFYPDGTIDSTIIHLGAGQAAYTLYVNPMNGRLVLINGYSNVTFNG